MLFDSTPLLQVKATHFFSHHVLNYLRILKEALIKPYKMYTYPLYSLGPSSAYGSESAYHLSLFMIYFLSCYYYIIRFKDLIIGSLANEPDSMQRHKRGLSFIFDTTKKHFSFLFLTVLLIPLS